MRKSKLAGLMASSCCLAATAIAIGAGIFIGNKIQFNTIKASALETDASIIEEILGVPVGNVNEETIKAIERKVDTAINMVATGKRDSSLPSNVLYSYDKYFGDWTEKQEACRGTILSYVTYLYGNDSFKTEFKVQTCGKEFTVIGSMSDGDVIIYDIEELFNTQREEYEALKGDTGVIEEPIPDEVYIPEPTENPVEEGLTEQDQQFYDETGYTSQRSDEVAE